MGLVEDVNAVIAGGLTRRSRTYLTWPTARQTATLIKYVDGRWENRGAAALGTIDLADDEVLVFAKVDETLQILDRLDPPGAGLAVTYRDRIGTLGVNLKVASTRIDRVLANSALESGAQAAGLSPARVEEIEEVVKGLVEMLPR